MSKILINNLETVVLINDVGISIASSGQYTIPPQDYLLWAASSDVQSLILNGNLSVSDGEDEFLPSEGIRFLQYPDRPSIQLNGIDISKVVTNINFIGGVAAESTASSSVTINVTGGGVGDIIPRLREVTMIMYSFGPINIESRLLFEADPIIGTINFLNEEIIP